MRVLICPNGPGCQFVSALSENKIRELIGQYDIVVDECSNPDLQEEDDNIWCRIFVAGPYSPKTVERMIEAFAARRVEVGGVPRRTRELPANGPQNGFEIFTDAKSLSNIFAELGMQVTNYDGPSGHDS